MHRYRKRAEDLRVAARSVSHADNNKITDARNDKILHLQNDLNRQMMRLSLAERQRRWPDYYARLTKLRSGGDKSQI